MSAGIFSCRGSINNIKLEVQIPNLNPQEEGLSDSRVGQARPAEINFTDQFMVGDVYPIWYQVFWSIIVSCKFSPVKGGLFVEKEEET